MSPRTLALTALALIPFAANSVLTRLAIAPGDIDAATFASVRIAAGALTLWAIVLATRSGPLPPRPDWRMALALFGYVAAFSFAYVWLEAGTGALILFGSVQLTMFAVALVEGERFSPLAWAGLAAAFGGLVYLVSPGLSAPDPFGAVLMTIAGISWGFYSLYGRTAGDPLAATAWNFLLCTPLVIAVSLLSWGDMTANIRGLALAVVSGAVASGLGYVIWYAALRGLTAGRAAVAQLAVPAIAAIGGALFIAEPVTLRLILASAITLGGVAIVLTQRAPRSG
ncbi:MAG: DMT family transporter [Hyphomicrobiaceae bacterium]|nr:DMT family transporter [Hyphomicrobiaceae bacterium]